jgi:hypothetical protein
MAFAPLTYRESLRDIEVCLAAQAGKLYHMGIATTVARSTWADARHRHGLRRPGDRLPLCVDLDATLFRSDTLIDSMTSGAGNWRVWSALLTLLSKGRAAMKREVAQFEPTDASSLPYKDQLL